jgi:hypothetical protein
MTALIHSKLYTHEAQRTKYDFIGDILVLLNLTMNHNVQQAISMKGGWQWTVGEATCVSSTLKVQFNHEVSRQLRNH